MKIALVHDYLKEYGGAERVLEALHDIWPEAPVYTSFIDFDGLGPHAERIKKWDIRPSWANNWLMKKLHSPLRFLAPLIWESFDFKGYDVVISSSGWYICRGIITQPETVHICYLHHPPRHLYGYATATDWQRHSIVRIYATFVNTYLRFYDYLAAQRVDYFVANSKETERRIRKFYRRESTVIYPAVKSQNSKAKIQSFDKLRIDPERSRMDQKHNSKVKSEKYYLCVSRLARAKHIDLAIEACGELGLPLKIVGKGREEGNFNKQINKYPNIQMLREVNDEELDRVYAGARALICPFEDEEFGIVAVEAMARGVPVIAYRSGGLPEVVVEGKTGVFFDTLTSEALKAAIKQFVQSINRTITNEACRKQAEKFSEERFRQEIVAFVQNVWQEKQREQFRRISYG